MKKTAKLDLSTSTNDRIRSTSDLDGFYLQTLREMYYAENQIAVEYDRIKDYIVSPNLKEILTIHYEIHRKHKERLEKIFHLKKVSIAGKDCRIFDALLEEGKKHLLLFKDDQANWEIALILLSQKLTHYKIASYGGLAHLAISLKDHRAAALLAFSVQEEDEFVSGNLNRIIGTFLSSHIEGFKK